jgi:hypothetical protein
MLDDPNPDLEKIEIADHGDSGIFFILLNSYLFFRGRRV